MELMELNLKLPCTKEEIKNETDKLRSQIHRRESELELLRIAMRHYQKQCDHKEQKTGYNEFRGNWSDPCPICGAS